MCEAVLPHFYNYRPCREFRVRACPIVWAILLQGTKKLKNRKKERKANDEDPNPDVIN